MPSTPATTGRTDGACHNGTLVMMIDSEYVVDHNM